METKKTKNGRIYIGSRTSETEKVKNDKIYQVPEHWKPKISKRNEAEPL